MINCDLLTLLILWNVHNKKCVKFSLTFLGTENYDCVIKTTKMFSFLFQVQLLFD